MTNRDFLHVYAKGNIDKRCICNHLSSDGFKLAHYSTVICELDFDRHFAYMNIRKYSANTSKIQSWLRSELESEDWKIVGYEGEPAYMWNAGYIGAPRMTKEDIPF